MDTLQFPASFQPGRRHVFRLEQHASKTLDSTTRINTRRPHKKSRAGCLSCKVRRVKCDEGDPECIRCVQKGLACKYIKKSSYDARPKNEYRPIDISKKRPSLSTLTCSPNPTIATLINNNLLRNTGGTESGLDNLKVFDVADVLRLQHFQSATCATLGSYRIRQVYQAELTRLAINHMHLMHAILTLSTMHIRYLESSSQRPSRPEVYHWQQTLVRFRQKIAPRIGKDEADSMLATATLINGIAFAMVETTRPHESWPLSSSAPNDLGWLSLQGGISLVFDAALPLHGESVLGDLFCDELEDVTSNECPGLVGLPQELVQLCQITAQSTAENNPYYTPLWLLAPLLELVCTAETLLHHLGFLGSMRPEYITLLRVKDHKALLILSYWYATLCSYDCWWTIPRSRTGCTAICMYLEEHADDNIQALLPFPAQACGYQLTPTSPFTGELTPQILVPCPVM